MKTLRFSYTFCSALEYNVDVTIYNSGTYSEHDEIDTCTKVGAVRPFLGR